MPLSELLATYGGMYVRRSRLFELSHGRSLGGEGYDRPTVQLKT